MFSTQCSMNRLREIREDKNYTLEQVAKALHTTLATIQRFEAGTRNVSLRWLEKLAIFYEVTVADLVDKDSIKNKLQPAVGNAIAKIHVASQEIPIYGPSPGGGPVKLLPENIVGHTGTFTDHVRRYKSLLAVVMVGDSMAPRHRHGELVRLAENALPQAGNDCAVQLKDDELRLFEFIKQTSKEYVLRTLHPEKEIRLPVADIKAVHLVIR